MSAASFINRLPERIRPCFTIRDLVFIGIFASVLKAASLLIAFMGGGMNPLTLILKNFVFTALMLVLVHKVRKPWTITLAMVVTSLVSVMLMGQGITHAPGQIVGCLVAEFLVLSLGGYSRTTVLTLGIFALEIVAKVVSLGIVWLKMREQPGLIVPVAIFITIGTLGTFGGLFGGLKFVKELRHASILS